MNDLDPAVTAARAQAYLPDGSPGPYLMYDPAAAARHLAVRAEPEFPEGFQGSGPMFAAVPLGNPWYDLAVRGERTYVVEVPQASPDDPETWAFTEDPQVAGWAFLARADAEAAADAHAAGEFTRYEGLCGWNDCTPAREEAERQALEDWETRADIESDAEAARAGAMTDAEWELEYGS